MQNDMFLDSGASISQCHCHRVDLWRIWSKEKPFAAFILLNPSTANAYKNDPTVTRCIKYAEAWGYGGLHVLNLFSLRSTDPKALYTLPVDEISMYGRNLSAIIRIAGQAGVVVCGWGNHGEKAVKCFGKEMADRLIGGGIELSALKINKNGSPQHPLYLGADLKPMKYKP